MEWYVREPERPADQQDCGRLGDYGAPVPMDGGHSQVSFFLKSGAVSTTYFGPSVSRYPLVFCLQLSILKLFQNTE